MFRYFSNLSPSVCGKAVPDVAFACFIYTAKKELTRINHGQSVDRRVRIDFSSRPGKVFNNSIVGWNCSEDTPAVLTEPVIYRPVI